MVPAIPIPTDAAPVLAAVILAFIAGATVPTYYATERIRGFGRKVASKLPYQPPPGKDTEEAMIEAAENDVKADGIKCVK